MIKAETIEMIKEKLISVYKPKVIYLFGSFAWGTPNEDSDLDLLIVVDHSDEKSYKRPLKGIRALRGLKVAEEILVYTVDEFEDISKDISTLCYKIRNEGKKIYEAA